MLHKRYGNYPSAGYYANKQKELKEPIQEAIYDFGGANVKSCASIALSKSISKGLIPPGTQLPHQWATTSNTHQNLIASPSMINIIELCALSKKFEFQIFSRFINC